MLNELHLLFLSLSDDMVILHTYHPLPASIGRLRNIYHLLIRFQTTNARQRINFFHCFRAEKQ
jgi:hypothetical protein